MRRPVRRALVLGLGIGVGLALRRAVGRRSPTPADPPVPRPRSTPTDQARPGPATPDPAPGPAPTEPPAAGADPADGTPPPPAPAIPGEDGVEATWVAPVEGACPDGYPVKAKESSGIFHVPGGLSYARTRPDRCYPTPEAARADGFRPAQR